MPSSNVQVTKVFFLVRISGMPIYTQIKHRLRSLVFLILLCRNQHNYELPPFPCLCTGQIKMFVMKCDRTRSSTNAAEIAKFLVSYLCHFPKQTKGYVCVFSFGRTINLLQGLKSSYWPCRGNDHIGYGGFSVAHYF